MEMCSLFNQLGKLIHQRGTIEQELRLAKSEHGKIDGPQLEKIKSLEVQHEHVQQQIFVLDEEISISENDLI
jgi:hypothetical protein